MFIYVIENKINNKKYVGATTRKLSERKIEHFSKLNCGSHPNDKLQNSWNKYGSDNFVFKKIDNANTLDELDFLEEKYISEFGHYNLLEGGIKNFRHSEETKEKLSESLSGNKNTFGKTWKQKERIRKNRSKKSWPDLIDPSGNVVKIYTIRLLIEKYNEQKLYYNGIRQLLNGEIDYYKGWTRRGAEYIDRGHTISNKMRPEGYPPVISPDGTIYNIEVLTRFCKRHNLSAGCMSQVINHKSSSHKGWKVVEK